MKKIMIGLFLGSYIFLPADPAGEQHEKFKLTNPVLKMLDGIRWMLDGPTIRDILHIRREGRKLQYGVPHKETKKMVGKYLYEGEHYSIHQLADIEAQIDHWYQEEVKALEMRCTRYQEFTSEKERITRSLSASFEKALEQEMAEVKASTHKEADIELAMLKARKKLQKKMKKDCKEQEASARKRHMLNQQDFDSAMQELQITYNARLEPMRACLIDAREDFKKINEPYLQQVRGAKQYLLRLVAESCTKRKRFDSFLMKWAEVPEGEEFAAFDRTVTTMQGLNRFLTDLSNFFEDLIHSCPKGWKQYQELIKQK